MIKRGIFLFHGSAIKKGKYGYVFLGPSGAGKTTISKLALHFDKKIKKLNDDIVMILRKKGKFFISSAPFEKFDDDYQIYPLKSIFLLKKGKNQTSLDELSLNKKIEFLKKNLIAKINYDYLRYKKPKIYRKLLKKYSLPKNEGEKIILNLVSLIKKTPVYLLTFEKNGKFLKFLTD